MTTPVETRTVPLRDRTITIKMIGDAQLALLAREARLLTRDGIPGERKVSGAARMFDIMESMVVSEEDREYVEDLIATGGLDLREFLGFIEAFKEEAPPEKPKVRRGRPPTKRVTSN